MSGSITLQKHLWGAWDRVKGSLYADLQTIETTINGILGSSTAGTDTTSGAALQATPANPPSTVSASGVMMGINQAFVPQVSGTVLMHICGTVKNSASGGGAQMQLRYGTGAVPGHGVSLIGAIAGGAPIFVAAAANQTVPFCLEALVMNLGVSVPLWVDLSLAALVTGTASVSNLSVTLVEL
jgi:hypothetical protein